jgi:hypothetical protein
LDDEQVLINTGSLLEVDVPVPFLDVTSPATPGKGSSSRGTMSMRKSNWSDLLNAFAISERESVRRLFESAIINARAVISAINTENTNGYGKKLHPDGAYNDKNDYALSQALQNKIGAIAK